jgi:hypothetical protein
LLGHRALRSFRWEVVLLMEHQTMSVYSLQDIYVPIL